MQSVRPFRAHRGAGQPTWGPRECSGLLFENTHHGGLATGQVQDDLADYAIAPLRLEQPCAGKAEKEVTQNRRVEHAGVVHHYERRPYRSEFVIEAQSFEETS